MKKIGKKRFFSLSLCVCVCVTRGSVEMSSDYYFDSYSHFGIHEEMLKDTVRSISYKRAIMQNKHLFDGKVVLDIGCGTGILSMFAASAGAKLVIGVEMSSIIESARQIIQENGFEGRIVLLQGKMEEVQLPVPKVDIIISEWMGYFLLYESMLDTVLYARDRYLKEGGLVFPNRATMFLTGIEDAQYRYEKNDYWNNVYGFSMSCMADWAISEPLVDVVEEKAVLADDVVIKEIDILTISKEDLAFESEFELRVTRQDTMHAFIGYFDISFPSDKTAVSFSTGPHAKYTHWKQTVFYLQQPIQLEKGDLVKGTISVKPNDRNHRELDIQISHSINNKEEDVITQQFHMC